MNDWKLLIGKHEPEHLQRLNRIIAERLGLKVTVTPRDGNGYLVLQKDRRKELVYLEEWYDSDSTETWGRGLPIPEYTTDLNIAASLPYDHAANATRLIISCDAFGVNVRLQNQDGIVCSSMHQSEAIARCYTWLHWKDQTDQ